ncbi:MAG: O-antigen ligase family protein [Flavobacteriales bacterium]|nr:O-antigen ligase family protein [Flavobacteriales bacterium]
MVLVILMWSALGFASLISGTRAPTWNWKEMLLLGSPFLLMLLDSARASQWSAAWKLAETSSVLLLFPIGFTMIDRSRAPTLRDRMIDLFSWSALTLAIWANGGILIRSEAWPSAVDASVAFSYFYRTAFAMVTGVHAPFAAYWFFCAALFQMHHVLQDKHTPPWRSLLAGALTIAGILIGSRMPIIAFGVAFASLLFFRFETRKALGWIFGTVVTLSILVIALPGSRDRAMEVFSTLYSRTGANGINSVSVRSPILQCSLELLEEHWILGAGQPAVQSALDECYSDQQHSFMADGSYSTHNQLLHWWLSFGVLGVTAFVLLFGHSLAEAFRRRDAIHFAFVLFILLCCFTENVLARQWGVVLFACFNTLFLVPIPKQDEGSEG